MLCAHDSAFFRLTPLAVAAPIALVLASTPPSGLDSALFGPLGSLVLGCLAFFQGGPLGLAGAACLYPMPQESPAPVSAGAPLHVFSLLGIGLLDSTADHGAAASPMLGFLALGLGGLWSRRLGPHREVWVWDVVEISALDLYAADICADHAWAARHAPLGVLWGGAEVRLFRLGLAASHHHLSGTGLGGGAPLLWAPAAVAASPWPSLFLCSARGRGRPPVPLRNPPGWGAPRSGPGLAGEASLATWGASLLAPASSSLATWGAWGGGLLSWLLLIPLLLPFGDALRGAGKPAIWAHLPLAPLSHLFATQLP